MKPSDWLPKIGWDTLEKDMNDRPIEADIMAEPMEIERKDRVLCVEDVAAIAHEANRAYCLSLGDTSQAPWPDVPQWQRDSVCNGVRWHLAYPDASAMDSHNNWLKEKGDAGWTYGEVKDVGLKQHPSLLPFHLLPPAIQLKDHAFKALVKVFAPLVVWHPEAS